MGREPGWTLRRRLQVIITLALVPVVLVSLFQGVARARMDIANVHERLLQNARTVAAGDQNLLAAAEQVKPPTMTRLVRALEDEGLVRRESDPNDGRVVRMRATAKGESLLHAGRSRRVRRLAAPIGELTTSERETLREAAEILARVVAKLS